MLFLNLLILSLDKKVNVPSFDVTAWLRPLQTSHHHMELQSFLRGCSPPHSVHRKLAARLSQAIECARRLLKQRFAFLSLSYNIHTATIVILWVFLLFIPTKQCDCLNSLVFLLQQPLLSCGGEYQRFCDKTGLKKCNLNLDISVHFDGVI